MTCNDADCTPAQEKFCPRIIDIARFLKCDFRKTLSDCGLFPGQDRMIITIKRNEGITASALANQFRCSLATASVSVKRMERAGFIQKKADEKDARVSHLYLTDKAKAVTDNVQDRCQRQEEIITDGMSEEEKKLFLCLLDRALDNIKKEVVLDHEK